MTPKRSSRLAAAILIAVLSAWVPASHAGGDTEPTGLDLISRCNALRLSLEQSGPPTEGEAAGDYGYCLGYLVGFVGGFAARDALGEDARFCPPRDARVIDFLEAMHQWLTTHPADLEQPAPWLAVRAYHDAFPCGAGEPGQDEDEEAAEPPPAVPAQ